MYSRGSGVLLHISSLPGLYGIGSLGKFAYNFIDFLRKSGQSYWQILPIGQTGYGDSPYQSFSAFSGNPYFIDIDILIADGFVSKDFITHIDFGDNIDYIDYEKIYNSRKTILRECHKNIHIAEDIEEFKTKQSYWISDYALFMAVKEHFNNVPIWEWPDKDILQRKPDALIKYSELLAKDVEYHIFVQYLFFRQYNSLKKYANDNGISIIGDIPIYIAADSVDIWVNSNLFKVNKDKSCNKIAGVPPDYYSQTGQLWGNPVYNWPEHEKTGYSWWISRIQYNLKIFDCVRIDHFRGFYKYWEVDAEAETAVSGSWVDGPGLKLFNIINSSPITPNIIAEDLGDIDEDVRIFLKNCGYPGMKVMLFGLNENEDNEHLPHNYCKNLVVYTSTHDSHTFVEFFNDVLTESEKNFTRNYIRLGNDGIGMSAIKTLFASGANLAIVPLQDILSLGGDARMNIPSQPFGNWKWRVRGEAFGSNISEILYTITKTYKRI